MVARHVNYGIKRVTVWQLARLRGNAPGDRGNLVAAGQFMVDHHELFLQLDRDLHHWRQDEDERAGLLARRELGVERLHDLGAIHKPVGISQHQDRCAIGRGQWAQRLDRRERIGSSW